MVGHEDDGCRVTPKAFVALEEPARALAALAAELQEFITERIAPHTHRAG